MKLRDLWSSSSVPAPRASLQSSGPGTLIVSPQQLDEALREGNRSSSGVAVTAETAMRVAAVFGCVRLICSPVGTLPLNLKRRIDARTREDASDHWAWPLLRRRPNKWQKPNQFKRMMQAHVLLRGNAYAYKVPGVGGRYQALIPLHPDRVEAKQLDDWSMEYRWTRKNGQVVTLRQDEVLHLFGLTLDGITGVTPLTYARETIGLSLSMDRHMGKVVKKGARTAGFLKSPKALTDKAFNHLKESLEEYRQDGDKEGEVMLLEEGLDFTQASMTPQDLQFIEGRKLSRSEIAMFFGVPPHMLGDTEKSTSWGTGIEQQTQGFVTYTLQDHLTMWEEGVTVDLVDDPEVFAQFNLSALLRGDTKARWDAHVKALQWGVRNPNEVRALEDENPRVGGDEYYDPPNTAGGAAGDTGDGTDDPSQPPSR